MLLVGSRCKGISELVRLVRSSERAEVVAYCAYYHMAQHFFDEIDARPCQLPRSSVNLANKLSGQPAKKCTCLNNVANIKKLTRENSRV